MFVELWKKKHNQNYEINNQKENKEESNHLTTGKIYYTALWIYDL